MHEIMHLRTTDGQVQKRQRTLVLCLPAGGAKRSEVRRLTPELAERYAGKTDKTVTRDLNRLRELGLVRAVGDHWMATIDQMDAFLPIARR